MTCLSQTVPLASRGGTSFLLGWLAFWRHPFPARRRADYLATLDDRALCDLGLSRDVVHPVRPRDPAGLWLNRLPG